MISLTHAIPEHIRGGLRRCAIQIVYFALMFIWWANRTINKFWLDRLGEWVKISDDSIIEVSIRFRYDIDN